MRALFILSFIISISLYGQEQSLKIDYSPVSPEAAMLFKFSDIPVGYYTGTPNIDIPIYQIQEGNLNVPIRLSYHSGGNKVKDIAPWTGLGWSLNGAGIITREVRGLPDDTNEGEGFLTFIQNHTLAEIAGLSPSHKANLYQQLSSSCKDSEPDMFYFRTNGLQGKFMFDWNGNIRVESNRKIKIDYSLGTNSRIIEFRITDDFGNIYTFNQMESTSKESNPRNGFCGLLNRSYVSGWKLSFIVNNNTTHRVDFQYDNFTINHTREITETFSTPLGTCPNGNGPSTSRQSVIYTTSGKRLKKIISNNVVVDFNINTANPRGDIEGNNLYPLDNIQIFNTNNKRIKKLNFVHDSSTGRLTLKRIDQISNTNETLRLYNFEYHNQRLPNYTSYSTDHWGYYNNENNQVSYPRVALDNSECPRYLKGGNKEPSETYSKAGILTKIIYPTGGYSFFDYENHDYHFIQNEEVPVTYEKDEDIFFVSATSNGAEVLGVKNFTITGNKDSKLVLNVTGNTITTFGGSAIAPRFKIFDTSNQLVFSIPPIPYTEPGQSFSKEYIQCLPPGNYKAVASTQGGFNPQRPGESNSIGVRVSWTQETSTLITKRKAGGVRIKEIKEYDVNDALLKRKRFEYTLTSNSNKSSGAITAFPNYIDTGYFLSSVSGNGNSYQVVCSQIEQFSGSLTALGSAYGHVEYSEVSVYEGTGTEQNKTKYEFYSYDNGTDIVSMQKPYPPVTSNHFKRNLLKKETRYKFENNIYTPVQESEYEYQYSQSVVPSLKVNFRISGIVVGGTALGLDRYAEANYNNNLGHNQMIKKTDRLFNSNGTTENVTSYSFIDNLTRLKETTSSTSRINENIKTIISYADSNVNNTTTQTMVSKNMIAIPIKQETFLNTDKLSTQSTQFKNWGVNRIFPEVQEASKKNDIVEPLLTYYNYDVIGNPLDISKENGTHIIYIWGYQSMYPIAKIENATYTQISSFVTNLKTKSNADNDRTIGNIGKEGALRQDLQALRIALPNALVTTYTYDPLIGVTSMTDPRGYTMYYHYDTFNRLEFVKDADGNLVSENKYNYKN